MTSNEIWHQVLSSGHTYWITEEDRGRADRIAVADWSMRVHNQPGSQNDGLLILDQSRPIVLSDNRIHIPLINQSGVRTHTVGTFLEAVLLCQKFGMYLSICDVKFEPVEMCSVPDCNMPAKICAPISINNQSKTLLPVCKVHADAAFEDKPKNETKG